MAYPALRRGRAEREDGMQITILDDAGSTAKVVLAGKLDISGAEKIALPLATLAGGKRGLLLDMTGVTFLASIGIRHLVMASKALARRGGRLVLLNPNALVTDVLTTSGVVELMAIAHNDAEAAAALGPQA
jgi:anti-sigma B factor antagonist